MEISLGQVASQAPVLVQCPNPSSSICATMLSTRCFCSGWPCGNFENCEILAETKRLADEFLQDDTQAPHPMQAATSNAMVAVSLSIGIALPSGALPVLTAVS